MKVLETDRLLLRAFQENDLDDFYEYSKNPNIGPNAGWEPHADKEVSLNIINSFLEKEEVWAIVYKANNKVIGSIGLHKDHKRVAPNLKMIGYVLSEEYWGSGLMTEAAKRVVNYAFIELNLDLVSVYHYTFNNKSKRVIEKCGFRYEGTIRMGSQIYDGSIYDDVCYSITKEEFYGN